MHNRTAMLLAVLMAAVIFSGPTVSSQAGSTSEVTFYVH